MARVTQSTGGGGLAEMVDRILERGLVIDAWAKISLVGIELLAIEARSRRGVGRDVLDLRGSDRSHLVGSGTRDRVGGVHAGFRNVVPTSGSLRRIQERGLA